MRPLDPRLSPFPWAHLVGGNYRNGLEEIALSAEPAFARLKENVTVEEQDAADAAAQLAAMDRLLLAAAQRAHGLGMCRLCFLTEARRAYFFADEFAFPDNENEFEQIAGEDARPCDCPTVKEMPLLWEAALSLRNVETRD